ncbi:MAG TPA: hypothetical protein HPQ03_06955 [Deltaproteobacteria bacterium]|nr:hypothetical protein [Deltaproteobacteria bacterium]
MLTKKEILKLLKNESIFLGRNPDRTFDFYEENGLLPVPEGFRSDSPLYPDHTPWVFKDILFAQQVGKRTMEEIKREFRQGIDADNGLFLKLELADTPLNIYHKQKLHGRYGSKDSDVLVAIYETEIIFFLVEGFRESFVPIPDKSHDSFRIVKKKVISMEAYGEYVKDQAVKCITGEGRILEETYLFEVLFGGNLPIDE